MTKAILPFLVVFISLSLSGAALGGIPITALLVEFEKLKMQIEEADVDQEVRDRTLELWAFTQTVALNPNHSTPIKMKQLEILKCMILLEFPEEEQAEPITTLQRAEALLLAGSTAADKPVQRDQPEVAPPAGACTVEIQELNKDTDVFESESAYIISLDPFGNAFVRAVARPSEPGSVEWFEVYYFDLMPIAPGTGFIENPLLEEIPPNLEDTRVVTATETNGILEIKLRSDRASALSRSERGTEETVFVKAIFTSADGQRKCEDRIQVTWRK